MAMAIEADLPPWPREALRVCIEDGLRVLAALFITISVDMCASTASTAREVTGWTGVVGRSPHRFAAASTGCQRASAGSTSGGS